MLKIKTTNLGKSLTINSAYNISVYAHEAPYFKHNVRKGASDWLTIGATARDMSIEQAIFTMRMNTFEVQRK